MSRRGKSFSLDLRTTFGLVLCISVVSLTFVGVSRGQTIVQQEPGSGMLHSGETVLVDDHSCPKGQIKEVIGGADRRYVKDIEIPGEPRRRHCVPRP